MRGLVANLGACALLLAGCEEPALPKSWRLTYARVLAVRAEVIGDDARATPEPGERVRVNVLIVGDQPIEQLSYAMIACPAEPPRGELPSCAGAPFFSERREHAAGAGLARELAFELDVPDEDGLGGAERVLFGGTVCAGGTAELAANGDGRCVGGEALPVDFFAHVEIAGREGVRNRNPVLAHDAIRFDGDVWPPYAHPDLPPDEDAGSEIGVPGGATSLTARADGKEHEIAISLETAGRETSDEGPEELLLSHFVTAGVLGRRFSVLERDQDGTEPLRVRWHMPQAPELPSRVLSVFVLRDQRGGVAYALRELEIR